MPTIDHMYEIKYRRDMTEVALAVGLNPPHVPEDGALDAILACVREVTRRAAEAQCDANYWQGRYEAVCEEHDGLTARAERAEADRDNWKMNILSIERESDLAKQTLADIRSTIGAFSEEGVRAFDQASRLSSAKSLHHPDGGECPTCSDDRGPLRSPCPTLCELDADK